MSNKNIVCIIPTAREAELQCTVEALADHELVRRIVVVGPTSFKHDKVVCLESSGGLQATSTWHRLSQWLEADFVLIYTQSKALSLGPFALERFVQACEDSGAGLVYSDYYEVKEGQRTCLPLIDYQEGSLRDDFNFGSLLLFSGGHLKKAVEQSPSEYKFAALYDLRLRISRVAELFHLPEPLYTEEETDTRKSGEKLFDYVDPRNRDRQVEMELACTAHLKEVGAYLKPVFQKVDFQERAFPVEASVIIPVRNREKTIADAIESVLKQSTSYPFNLIIVDNHSSDATTAIIDAYDDPRLVHLIPERHDLGIGGCWNYGVHSQHCGKFAIQLDSDDLYIDGKVLDRIIRAFYEQNCAMLVGSYQMVNFELQEIPPGLIDHREWTPENGRNNALRINGLGAPRAFYTPVLRQIKLPNTSYGEDYAVGLAISRNYQIGRLYEPLYLCRRWDDNSDAALDVQKMNKHNRYKDKLRTMELRARKQLVIRIL